MNKKVQEFKQTVIELQDGGALCVTIVHIYRNNVYHKIYTETGAPFRMLVFGGVSNHTCKCTNACNYYTYGPLLAWA